MPNELLWEALFLAGLLPVVYLFVNALLSRRRSSSPRVLPVPVDQVTIVVPVHGERPDRFRASLASVVRQGARVVVVGDGASEPYDSLAREAGAEFIGLPVQVGKKRALAEGLRRVGTPFVLFVDSDTVIAEHAVRDLSTYFAEDVGGVGANLYVRPNGSAAARAAEFVERAREVVLRAMSSRGNVLYLDGACMMFRTDLIRAFVLSPAFQDLTVLGRPTRLGDDWQLTDHVLRQGQRTVRAYGVAAITERPDTFADFLRQNVRWSRSSWIRLGRYLRGEGPRRPGLFYRFELVGTYALPLLALGLGLLRLPMYLHLFDHLLFLVDRALDGLAGSPSFLSAAPYLGRFLSFQSLLGALAGGAFVAAVARRVPREDRARTVAWGLLGSALLLLTTVYGLVTFWRSPAWRRPLSAHGRVSEALARAPPPEGPRAVAGPGLPPP